MIEANRKGMTMAGHGARRAAMLMRPSPGKHPALRLRSRQAFGNCPLCRKPFEQDPEVGPVPTCACGERGKVNPYLCPLPTDNERMMNAKWSGPDHD
jgi:hypothetical protein